MPTVGSMFSGAGLLDYGLERAGMRVVWHAETDKDASKVLASQWPTVPNLGDVTAVDWSKVETPDVLVAGFPCPPFSSAGKRLGRNDDRYLWPVVMDAIRSLRPRCVLLENVAALLSANGGSIFGEILGDLAEAGFDAKWTVLRASDVGVPHRRERVFIAAYSYGEQPERRGELGELGGAQAAQFGEACEWQRPGDTVVDSGQTSADSSDDGRSGGGLAWGRGAGSEDDGDAASADSPDKGSRSEGSRERVVSGSDSGVIAPDTESEPRCSSDGDGLLVGVWGPYAPAIARWERVIGEPAPNPLDERGRLNVELTRWMMGAPPEWHGGLSRSGAIRAYGNGVVCQVAEVIGHWVMEGMVVQGETTVRGRL